MRTEFVREAVLILDLEKSSALTARYGNARAHEIKVALRTLVRPAAQQFGATLVKFTGDGYFITFPDETAAVRAAICILQNRENVVSARVPNVEVHCRIGIAYGELTVADRTDRQGAAANRAARVEAGDDDFFRAGDGGVSVEEFKQLRERDRVFIDHHAFTGLPSGLKSITRYLGWLELKEQGESIKLYHVDWTQAPAIALPPYVEPPEARVPRPSEYFVGRDELVAEVASLCRSRRLITLLGSPGIGKTQTACAVAHGVVEAGQFVEGAWFIDLQGATDAPALLSAGTTALQITDVANAQALALAIDTRDCLVVFDNVETPLAGDRKGVRAFFTDLLAYAGKPVFLLTSREPLGLIDERLCDVHPLTREVSRALFKDLAQGKGYAWRAGDDAALERLLDAWADVPLAIVLAADRLRSVGSMQALADRWNERHTLALSVPGMTPEERTKLNDLDYSISLSYLSLPEGGDARQLFGLFALLPAGASEALVRALFPQTWESAAHQLVDRSLARAEAGRCLMLAPLRAFAARLEWPEQADDMERLQAFFIQLAEEHGQRVGESLESLQRVLEELPNLHALMDDASRRSNDETVLTLIHALLHFYSFSGGGASAASKDRLNMGRAGAARLGARLGEANCIQSLGDVHRMLAESDAARGRYEAALLIYRAIDDRLGEANCIKSLGDVHQMLDEYEAARARYEESLPLHRAIGDRLGEANCIQSLGGVHQMLDEYEEARARFEEALPIHRAIGERLGEANCIQSLGDVHRRLAEYEAARARYEEALPIHRAIGDRLGEAGTLWMMGRLERAQGNGGSAREQYDAAIALYETIGLNADVERVRRERDGR